MSEITNNKKGTMLERATTCFLYAILCIFPLVDVYKRQVDKLIGLKENVIIGKLIPAGTGMKRYRDVRLSTDEGESLGYMDEDEILRPINIEPEDAEEVLNLDEDEI